MKCAIQYSLTHTIDWYVKRCRQQMNFLFSFETLNYFDLFDGFIYDMTMLSILREIMILVGCWITESFQALSKVHKSKECTCFPPIKSKTLSIFHASDLLPIIINRYIHHHNQILSVLEILWIKTNHSLCFSSRSSSKMCIKHSWLLIHAFDLITMKSYEQFVIGISHWKLFQFN